MTPGPPDAAAIALESVLSVVFFPPRTRYLLIIIPILFIGYSILGILINKFLQKSNQ